MRSIQRLEDVARRTVEKLMLDAGSVGRRIHQKRVRDIDVRNVQVDELWSFCYAKRNKVDTIFECPRGAGDVWTWIAIDSETKMILSYLVDKKTYRSCRKFIKDLRHRVNMDRLEIFSDANPTYPRAIKRYFGTDIPYTQMVKDKDDDGDFEIREKRIFGDNHTKSSTNGVERFNLTVRMGNKRYQRRTNGFSKKIENHEASIDLFILWYNWVRLHSSLGTAPAVRAGLTRQTKSPEWVVKKIDEAAERERQRRILYRRLGIEIK